ncbi:MAG: phosphoribosyltransferase [Massiliimalia sp.]|jgi:orotate phosphoribosyltransferase
MENHTFKIMSKNSAVPLKITQGHFATNHSHVNCYIDMTTLKARQSEAELAAEALGTHYITDTVVDTILCLDGTQIIGAYLAQELSKTGIMSINAHQTIYIVTPEHDTNGQMIFRDNIQPMIRGKHVLILTASITTGITVRKSMECIQYYGGVTTGISAIFSALDQVEGMDVRSIFTRNDIPEYEGYSSHECPLCRQGQKLDALVNGYGYSKL